MLLGPGGVIDTICEKKCARARASKSFEQPAARDGISAAGGRRQRAIDGGGASGARSGMSSSRGGAGLDYAKWDHIRTDEEEKKRDEQKVRAVPEEPRRKRDTVGKTERQPFVNHGLRVPPASTGFRASLRGRAVARDATAARPARAGGDGRRAGRNGSRCPRTGSPRGGTRPSTTISSTTPSFPSPWGGSCRIPRVRRAVRPLARAAVPRRAPRRRCRSPTWSSSSRTSGRTRCETSAESSGRRVRRVAPPAAAPPRAVVRRESLFGVCG